MTNKNKPNRLIAEKFPLITKLFYEKERILNI